MGYWWHIIDYNGDLKQQHLGGPTAVERGEVPSRFLQDELLGDQGSSALQNYETFNQEPSLRWEERSDS